MPHMVVHLHPDRLELHALLGLGGTLDWQEGRHLRLGLSAVLEQKGGRTFLLGHPPSRGASGFPSSADLRPRTVPPDRGGPDPMLTGLDRFLEDPGLRGPLAGRRVALLAHPASVTRNLEHA